MPQSLSNREQGEEGRRGGKTAHRRRVTESTRSPERRRWGKIAGAGEESPETEEGGAGRESVPLARLRAGGPFLKRDMGAPDSLQCLSGAHRTAHSSCPVNHRTAHRRIGF
jgi:hypothetical protein